MNYPLISEYIEAIKAAEDNFEELTNLRPVLGEDGQPVMTSGNFAVVFKMQDTETGKFYALKCFTKEQEGRAEAYHQIADALKDVNSPYLVSLRFLEKELFVDTDQTSETEFPVLLMDWVEGKTLDKYLRENLDDKYALEMLAYRFSQLAQWLIPQPFAHGDLKPDNILVREDGTLVLVDYDGMYVSAMKGQKARELGSPDFRHPLRTENDFDEHIDEFAFTSILISLKAISLQPSLLKEYGAADRFLLSEKDYRDIRNSRILAKLSYTFDEDLNRISNNFKSYWYKMVIGFKASFFLISKPTPLVNIQASISFDEWNNKIKKDRGFAYYSNNDKKLLRFYDSIGGEYMGEDWEDYISDYKIGNGTETICNKAFKGCHNLRFLIIPSSVKYIGEKAFCDCYFRFIELPDTIEYISKNAFSSCTYLRTIIIPPRSFRKFSEMLPNNIYQLKELNSYWVKSKLKSFLRQKKDDGISYWDCIMALLSTISNILNLFGNLKYHFNTMGNRARIRIEDENVFSAINEYNINDVDSLDEVVDAFYYLLLDINGIDVFNRTSYLYMNYEINRYNYKKRD